MTEGGAERPATGRVARGTQDRTVGEGTAGVWWLTAMGVRSTCYHNGDLALSSWLFSLSFLFNFCFERLWTTSLTQ